LLQPELPPREMERALVVVELKQALMLMVALPRGWMQEKLIGLQIGRRTTQTEP
jgi:hypothetical protein